MREELWEFPIRYSGQLLLKTAHEALIEAENKRYPINLETYLQEKQGDLIAHNFQQLSNWLNVNLNHMDEKIYRAEARMIENGDFNPDIRFKNDNEMSTVEMMAKAIATARNR